MVIWNIFLRSLRHTLFIMKCAKKRVLPLWQRYFQPLIKETPSHYQGHHLLCSIVYLAWAGSSNNNHLPRWVMRWKCEIDEEEEASWAATLLVVFHKMDDHIQCWLTSEIWKVIDITALATPHACMKLIVFKCHRNI